MIEYTNEPKLIINDSDNDIKKSLTGPIDKNYYVTPKGSIYVKVPNGNFQKKSVRLNQKKEKDLYLCVRLTVDGQKEKKLVHRLVAEAYLGLNSDDNRVVHHRDHYPQHNCQQNLEAVTPEKHVSIHQQEEKPEHDEKCELCGYDYDKADKEKINNQKNVKQ